MKLNAIAIARKTFIKFLLSLTHHCITFNFIEPNKVFDKKIQRIPRVITNTALDRAVSNSLDNKAEQCACVCIPLTYTKQAPINYTNIEWSLMLWVAMPYQQCGPLTFKRFWRIDLTLLCIFTYHLLPYSHCKVYCSWLS